MRLTFLLSVLVVLAAPSVAQTPFEFAIVEDLIRGEPFVSIIRIEISSNVPEPGRRTLSLSARVGMTLDGEVCVYPDSVTNTSLELSGDLLYTASVPRATLTRVLTVLNDCIGRFPSCGVTDLALDLVSVDDLSWLSLECPVSLADSFLAGAIDEAELLRMCSLSGMEIGSSGMQTLMATSCLSGYEPPAISTLEEPVPEPVPQRGMAWRSLVLPGWGQLSTGRGAGWVNLLVEAGGIGLMVMGEEEAGAAVLGVNHVVSFFDML